MNNAANEDVSGNIHGVKMKDGDQVVPQKAEDGACSRSVNVGLATTVWLSQTKHEM